MLENFRQLHIEQKMLDLSKLAEKYNIKQINVAYKDYDNPRAYISIPVNLDLFVRLRAWLAINVDTDQLVISKNLIGTDNYWLTQLQDDHKNKRIDLKTFIYDRH